ncbi:aminodeoxychorismate synthase component I [Heyndrickxia acidicola]|uniref:Aminodeoxychorismate synthase component I n=1 Tax=Heyndrickxia acidicola TaxID=209389 RepID=A0ABU6MHJ2_9BACI|nr:aminodeoxychorismate synthase component I [Heyndrickxia acidicola]MED1203868.1 aminodeoxychorismate synthase component I [Heyndrickxia acidicola]
MKNTKDQSDPFLFFEFADANGDIHPRHFKNPVQVISTYEVNEVTDCLEKVQQAVDQGFYAAGYLSYEAAPAFDPAFIVHTNAKMPLLWFGIFTESSTEKPMINEHSGQFNVSSWEPLTKKAAYSEGIDRIKAAIENGDTYQVNYTLRLQADFTGDSFSFYQQLSHAQDSNYSAYLHLDGYDILSASPELFFRWDKDKIVTRPMKGTIKRGLTAEQDRQNKQILRESIKDQAENVMIVDLLRNDLGSFAVPGSVKAVSLFDIESYPTVLQMTSSVAAKTPQHTRLLDLFTALFPCGSITGAPKVSTMKTISELEDTPREVYCGAIGFITPKNEAVFNVPIRTVVVDHETGKATYGVGGGVTWDSSAEGEYNEILTKASLLTAERPVFDLLESLRLENGSYYLLNRHVDRLLESAEYFNFEVSKKELLESLDEFAEKNRTGIHKVRLLLKKNGALSIMASPLTQLPKEPRVILAETPISSENVFFYHKTTQRKGYESHHSGSPNIFDVLLWNEKGELTEFTIGNAVFEIDGELWTPPVSCGLLSGTMREDLLAEGKIQERIILKKELQHCTRIWLINSVRNWVPVTFHHQAT